MDQDRQDKLDASVARRLYAHLDANKDVQNIDLMILADFCRNCLSKWYAEAAAEQGLSINDMDAREHIYGMSYAQWKSDHQLPASEAQLAALKARKN